MKAWASHWPYTPRTISLRLTKHCLASSEPTEALLKRQKSIIFMNEFISHSLYIIFMFFNHKDVFLVFVNIFFYGLCSQMWSCCLINTALCIMIIVGSLTDCFVPLLSVKSINKYSTTSSNLNENIIAKASTVDIDYCLVISILIVFLN